MHTLNKFILLRVLFILIVKIGEIKDAYFELDKGKKLKKARKNRDNRFI